MGAVGERLRRERLKSGLDLDRISQETKIPAHLLHAIEQEEFEKLPGRLFLFNFVRQYAHTLGLDEAQVIAQLRAEQEPPPPAALPEPPRARPKGTGVRVMLGGTAVAVVALVLGYTFAPSRSHSRVQGPAQAPRAVPQGSADRVVAPVPAPASPPRDVPSTGLHLVLIAKARTWVAVARDGHSAFTGTLHPSETRVLDGGATAAVVIGNPDGVEVSLNGKPIDISGPRGQLVEVRIAAPDAAPVVSRRVPLTDLY